MRPSEPAEQNAQNRIGVAVPTVERAFAPIRSWSTMIAVVRPPSTSTSGRASVGMNPCKKALYVSLINRCDSAAMVSKTSELFPDPDTPVNTVSRRFGISMLTSLRLFSRAPMTLMRPWLSATCVMTSPQLRRDTSSAGAGTPIVFVRARPSFGFPPSEERIDSSRCSGRHAHEAGRRCGGAERCGRGRTSGSCGYRRLRAYPQDRSLARTGAAAVSFRTHCPRWRALTATDDRVPPAPSAPPQPRRSPLQSYDPLWLLAVNAGVIGFMWIVHGGPERTTSQGWLIAIGQLAGLYAALAVLLGLVLISRAPWLERRYGMDRMTHFHRYTGFTAAVLMIVHVVTITLGLAWDTDITIWEQIVDSVSSYPYLVNAVIGFALLMVIAATSIRVVRRVLSYEHWWFVHVAAYAGVALAFGHQTAIGSDFVTDGWAVVYWSLLYLSAALLIFGYRFVTPSVLAVRHRFEVVAVEASGPSAVTVVVGGRGLERLPVQAGQFFLLRVLTRGRWWKAHPFSLSAPPDGASLRFTVKALGDDSTELQTIPIGTRLAIEGPYGGFLPFQATDRKLLYVAGGVGITPFRGLIEAVDRPEDVALIYRNRRPDDALFIDDLVALSERTGFTLRLSYSRLGTGEPNPFTRDELQAFVADVADREVFVVGSPRLISAARTGLRAAGVPASHIHYENFSY